ncbi:MAG: hypothetical protein COA84_14125 [Robiginitomaculum sp.]|nr:MAG: hypothetical protein COA84_14125 [Robiginitomaculum sp.]
MAKFTKPVDLWADNNEERIKSGALVLQRGQYVYCGDKQLSRYVGHSIHTINVVHGHNTKVMTARFRERVKFVKLSESRAL